LIGDQLNVTHIIISGPQDEILMTFQLLIPYEVLCKVFSNDRRPIDIVYNLQIFFEIISIDK